MKQLRISIPLFLIALSLSLNGFATRYFASENKVGTIGVTEEHPIDNPADNVFHFYIDEHLSESDQVWLVYELEGVEDHTSVSRSINDQLAMGGYLVRKRQGFSVQKEKVAAQWLRSGDNIVRFSIPAGSKHSYKVKNLRLEVDENSKPSRNLVVNRSTTGTHYGKAAYLNGYVTGDRGKLSRLLVDGTQVDVLNGAFEAVLRSSTPRSEWDILVEAHFDDGEVLREKVILDKPLSLDFEFDLKPAQLGKARFFLPGISNVLNYEGAEISIPNGAIGQGTQFSITGLRNVDMPALSHGMVNVGGLTSGYRFLPHCRKFGKELKVRLKYDPATIPEGYSPKDIRTYYFDEVNHQWLALKIDSVDTENQVVISWTDHFTDMVNSILVEPSTPEMEAFTPTMMKDIQAANASEMITLVEPPVADYSGAAQTEFPLNLPEGRGGIEPELAISYNSGAANNWLGLGWGLDVPAITVETRWGVPRYDAANESESYLLNGQQLTPLSHRDQFVVRTAEKRFYPRVESSFEKVIRHGSNPSNYWWEVTNKNGERYFYGGLPGTGIDNSAVLKDDQGNIAHWALREYRDLNENFVKYHYQVILDPGTVGGQNGRQIYIDRISYTGHGSTEGKYEVDFIRDRELSEPRRTDVVIAANSGFKEVTADLLRKIEISYNGNPVRSYQLKYSQGVFFKTLFSKLEEYDAAGNLFTEHEFSYYDDITSNGTYEPYSSSESWQPGNDGVDAGFLNPIPGFQDNASALSGTKSFTGGFGIGVSVGLADFNPVCKSLTIGGNFNFGLTDSEGLLYMADINGDGLPDKIFLGSNGLSYRANQSGTSGQTTFGPILPVSGINDFYKDRSLSFSGGFEAHGGCFLLSAFIGVNFGTTITTTSVYFTDANGDDLIDIAADGVVFFNRLDASGNPQFIPQSSGTPSPIFAGDQVSGNLFVVDSSEIEANIDRYPLHDIVRLWKAPFDGVISIIAPARLLEDPNSGSGKPDGVNLAIQLKGAELWSTVVAAGDYGLQQPSGVSNIQVQRGDQIYFRVQSIENGEFDQVYWNPKIQYQTSAPSKTNANGLGVYEFNAGDEFLLTALAEVGVPIDGAIRLQGSYTKKVTSDSVRVVIREEGQGAVLWQRVYSWDDTTTVSYDTTFNVSVGMRYTFNVETNTNIDWNSVEWSNYINYTASYDTNVTTVFTPAGDPMIELYPIPNYTVYAEPQSPSLSWEAPLKGQLSVTPALTFFTPQSGEIVFSVKREDELVGKKILNVVNGQLTGDSLIVVATGGLGGYYVEYHTQDTLLEDALQNSDAAFVYEALDTLTTSGFMQEIAIPLNAGGTATLVPQLSLSSVANGSILRTVVLGGIAMSDTIAVISGVIDQDSMVVNLTSDDTLFISYDSLSGISNLDVVSVGTEVIYSFDDTLGIAFHAKPRNTIFGNFYRQWGQFAYNGNRGRASLPIDEGELMMDTQLMQAANSPTPSGNDAQSLSSSFESQDAYEPKDAKFIFLCPDIEMPGYLGYDNLCYIQDTIMSSSRLGLDDLTPASPLPPANASIGTGLGAGAFAPKKLTTSNSISFSAGGGIGVGGFGVSGAYGISSVTSVVSADYMDMNGDRYPDIVIDDKVQYTSPFGGLSSLSVNHGVGESHQNSALSEGVTLGGSYNKPEAKSKASDAKKMQIHASGGGSGISGNFGTTEDETDFTWMDINGDGLPDRVNQNGSNISVALNLGYKLAPAEPWGVATINEGEAQAYGGGLGINIGSSSIVAGISLSRSENETKKTLQDVNGDGLVDFIEVGSQNVIAHLNTGNGFAPGIQWLGATDILKATSASEGVNVAFTVAISIPIVQIKIAINPSIMLEQDMTRDHLQISDVNGDGYPDFLESNDDSDLRVKLSRVGRTNLLRTINRPLGARIVIDYSREGNTYEMPNSVWALSGVEIEDGFAGDGADIRKASFVYEDGYYDRHEREFYGFGKVTTKYLDTQNNDSLYAQFIQEFSNDNYYQKGFVVQETMEDDGQSPYFQKEFSYQPIDPVSGQNLSPVALSSTTLPIFPAKVEDKVVFYEGQQINSKMLRRTYGYDMFGNLSDYSNFGDVGNADDLSATVSYHNVPSTYLVGKADSMVVTSSAGILRKRSTEIDPTGSITQVRMYLANGDFAQVNMDFDQYGNMTRMQRPENANGQRLGFDFTYDSDVNTYVTQLDDSYGYFSSTDYDLRFGQWLKRTDINGNEISYQLDDVGRIVSIKGPLEQNTAFNTLEFSYYPTDSVPWALTTQFDPQHPSNSIQKSVFIDGLGRVLQEKKDIALHQGSGQPDLEVMQVSERILYDAFGRVTHAYYPTTEALGTPGEFNYTFDVVAPTRKEYDVLDRLTRTILPDNSTVTHEYRLAVDSNNDLQISTLTTDQNSNQAEQFDDVRGRTVAFRNFLAGNSVWTTYDYNAIDERIAYTNDLGQTTTFEYDWMGRKVGRTHPDHGTSIFEYDLANNVVRRQSANLASAGDFVEFDFDFERLTGVRYPNFTDNDIQYFYGPAGAPDNRAGRIFLQVDATGVQEFSFDALGEISKNIRTVVIPQHDDLTFSTEWTYDTWNRVTEMIYPDSEKVAFVYDHGGMLREMGGEKEGNTYEYVTQLGYDKFQDRVYLSYGNGTETSYSYEPERRRLSTLDVLTASNRAILDNEYSYDNSFNVLSIENQATVPSGNKMGGPSLYTYAYDELYRLTNSSGNVSSSNDVNRYSLELAYNTIGGILQKNQLHERRPANNNNWTGQQKTSYINSYDYDSINQPNIATHVGDHSYEYDANGNLVGISDDNSGQQRAMYWDEENRLRLFFDNGAGFLYTYDATHTRVIKGKSQGQQVFVNGQNSPSSVGVGGLSIYPNPFITLSPGKYTKHYFIGDERVASKLGNSTKLGISTYQAGQDSIDYNVVNGNAQQGLVRNLKFLGIDSSLVTAGNSGKVPPGQVVGQNGNSGNNGNGGNGGNGGNNGNGGSGTSSPKPAEKFRYFFHANHLGSASFITDEGGEVHQHVEYFPYGGTFAEERTGKETSYLFNGKELDDESGFYYYGSRYYDPRVSFWLSVDPKADEFEGYSPYVYTLGNPVILVDPDGMASKGKRNFKSLSSKVIATVKQNKAESSKLVEPNRAKVAPPANKAYFWSGRTKSDEMIPDGNGGMKPKFYAGAVNAERIADEMGGTTLEKTIRESGIDMPSYSTANNLNAGNQTWADISEAYASQVTGEVFAVIGQDLRVGNIWETRELPRLKKNPNVTKITTIDPLTRETKVIFER